MLPEPVLEELTRSSWLQEPLVRLAWPDLSVDSKLQLITAIQGNVCPSTPTWLVDLAQSDASGFVRYWACRHACLQPPSTTDLPALSHKADTPCWERARDDAEPLVQATTAPSVSFNYGVLTQLPILQRLVTIRNLDRPSFSSVIDWLEKALTCMPVDELRQCVEEFFMHPQLKREMARAESEQDPHSAFRDQEALTKAWELIKQAPSLVQHQLIFRLPLKLGRKTFVPAEQLATLPEYLLDGIVCLGGLDSTPELERLKASIRATPDRYPSKVVKALQDAEEFAFVGIEDMRRLRQADRKDRSAVTLDEIFQLQTQVSDLSERLSETREPPKHKRFF